MWSAVPALHCIHKHTIGGRVQGPVSSLVARQLSIVTVYHRVFVMEEPARKKIKLEKKKRMLEIWRNERRKRKLERFERKKGENEIKRRKKGEFEMERKLEGEKGELELNNRPTASPCASSQKKRVEVVSSWSTLPLLVLLQVLSYLEAPGDRRNARCVCRHWCRCMNDSRLWKNAQIAIHKRSLTLSELGLLHLRRISRLSLPTLPPWRLAPILTRLWSCLPCLASLRVELQGLRRKEYSLRPLGKMRQLRELTVGGECVPVTIPDIPGLEQLTISGMVVAYTLPRARYESLWLLNYDGSSVFQPHSPDGRMAIHLLPGLSYLCMSNVDMGKNANWILNTFAHYPLTVLDLPYCTLSASDLSFLLSTLTTLHSLYLDGAEFTDDYSMVLHTVRSDLDQLSLRHCKLVNAPYLNGFCYSQSASSLVHLDLAHCTGACRAELLAMQSMLPGLQTIDLTGWTLCHFVEQTFRKSNIEIIR